MGCRRVDKTPKDPAAQGALRDSRTHEVLNFICGPFLAKFSSSVRGQYSASLLRDLGVTSLIIMGMVGGGATGYQY